MHRFFTCHLGIIALLAERLPVLLNQGPPTPANNKPEFRKQRVGYARKGQVSKGSWTVGRHGSVHKGAGDVGNIFSNLK